MKLKSSKGWFLNKSGEYKKESFPQFRPSSSRSVSMRNIGAAHTHRPQLQACGVTERVARGFTLIEFLVVVLIIAILAAVALPQYNKVVKKAQGREVYVVIDALDQALSEYYLTHGNYKTGISENPDNDFLNVGAENLSIQIPKLKYFKFYNYPTSQTVVESSDFQIGSVWRGKYYINIAKDGKQLITLDWIGEQLTATCNDPDCALYFDCPTVSLQASSIELANYKCNLLEIR